jgi:hypothetical protein
MTVRLTPAQADHHMISLVQVPAAGQPLLVQLPAPLPPPPKVAVHGQAVPSEQLAPELQV